LNPSKTLANPYKYPLENQSKNEKKEEKANKET
jgi:hypothetical protein